MAAIVDLPEDASSHREVADSRRANRDSHKREHLRFLAVIRELMSLAIIGAACRPRNRKGKIMYDSLSLIEQHGKERLYKGIRIPNGGSSYGDTWLFDNPLFKQIQTAVAASGSLRRRRTRRYLRQRQNRHWSGLRRQRSRR